MEKIITTDAEVMATLRAVVAERPDYVYDSGDRNEYGDMTCNYVQDGTPSCLVGHVLFRLGIPLTELSAFDVAGGASADGVARLVLDGVTESTIKGLWFAQHAQDHGDTWAEALAAAERA